MSPREIQEWWTPAAWAELRLVDMPASKRGVNEMADRLDWRRCDLEFPRNPLGIWRRSDRSGGGVEYRLGVLPERARVQLVHRLQTRLAEPRPTTQTRHAAMWESYDALPDRKKAKAREKFDALMAVDALYHSGMEKFAAVDEVARAIGVSVRTLYNWQAEIEGKSRGDWLPHLAPRHFGTVRNAECDPAAWEWYKEQYLRQEQPTHAESYRLLQKAAKKQGWTIPSGKFFERRIADEIPHATLVYRREGPDALKKLYPAQERDRTIFHALQAVNADGHTWDIFVRWADGKIGRPNMCAFQDLFSGKILSWRVDRSQNKEIVRLAFSDVVEEYGIPEECFFDNGRDFASKWITGGTRSRYRFKHRDEDPAGILPQLGVNVHFTTPYHGQAKPIERAFRDFTMTIAKDPRFAGAWTGNTIANKPENYGSKAIPIDIFLAVLEERIADHNAQLGRKNKACGGKLSFDQTFDASYEESPITRASEAQRRMLLLASELVSARKPDGAVFVGENRYWAEFLTDHIGRKVVLRLDPQDLHGGVHVEGANGIYLGFAPCVAAVGFLDADAARSHNRTKRDWLRARKAMADAETKLTIEDVAAMLPSYEPTPAPERRVIRPVFGANGNAALKASHEFEHDAPAMPISLQDAIRRMKPRQGNGADG